MLQEETETHVMSEQSPLLVVRGLVRSEQSPMVVEWGLRSSRPSLCWLSCRIWERGDDIVLVLRPVWRINGAGSNDAIFRCWNAPSVFSLDLSWEQSMMRTSDSSPSFLTHHPGTRNSFQDESANNNTQHDAQKICFPARVGVVVWCLLWYDEQN